MLAIADSINCLSDCEAEALDLASGFCTGKGTLAPVAADFAGADLGAGVDALGAGLGSAGLGSGLLITPPALLPVLPPMLGAGLVAGAAGVLGADTLGAGAGLGVGKGVTLPGALELESLGAGFGAGAGAGFFGSVALGAGAGLGAGNGVTLPLLLLPALLLPALGVGAGLGSGTLLPLPPLLLALGGVPTWAEECPRLVSDGPDGARSLLQALTVKAPITARTMVRCFIVFSFSVGW